MSAYLIVDVGDLLRRLQSRAFAVDLHDLANRLRSAAALAAGLPSTDSLKAIAVADWNDFQVSNPTVEQIFEGVGFEMCNIPDPDHLGDALMIHYFSNDPEPVDEMILVSTSDEMLTLASRVEMSPGARVRVWADAAPGVPGMIFQPLEAILGIQSKTVSLYIDFENIAISLNEQGYAINLDRLIEGLSNHASAHGQIMRMAAYAPWGQRGSLPPLVDGNGREVSDEAPSKLALANIDPVFNLPGKNSADMRIAKDVLADSTQPSAADIYIIASGDRDFNEVFGALRNRNKQVIVWGVRGSTSRQLENNPSVQIEYLDDFLGLQRYQTVGHIFAASMASNVSAAFAPSQWSSVILQFDRIAAVNPGTAE
ncbi:MAG: NYN domain-containing protein, partial [Anaerolineae bacterium]|nr:NYN domain-containing protein [Anaerolineae bacterium]